jgi:hypothetical protein
MAGLEADAPGNLAQTLSDLEARRDEQFLVVETQARRDQDTSEAERDLRAIEDELALLGARIKAGDTGQRQS